MNSPALPQKETAMSSTMEFRHAPPEWTPALARDLAVQEGLKLAQDHWEVIRSLQEFYARHDASAINLREIKDALEEKFHIKGGMKYLYALLPRGPVAQGCRLAGLKAPAGATDLGFGSVA
jgi:tRNA 2-thiouridine synthesizing protein E